MAYKPYNIPKNQDKNKKNSATYQKSNVKLFGFRSGVSYKMVLAIFYYGLMLLIYVPSIVNEIIHYQFTPVDIVLDISKYIFIGIFLFSPAIFLSDFKYTDSLPFFRKKSFGSGLCGLIIVFMFCYFMWNVDIRCMSKTYQDSVKAYEKVLEKEQNEKLSKMKKEADSKTETTKEK